MQYVAIYYFLINLVLFVMMGNDKARAVKNRWRIPEAYLFIAALLGGAVGGLLGMHVYRHKTKKPAFYIIFSIAIVMHIMCIYSLFSVVDTVTNFLKTSWF